MSLWLVFRPEAEGELLEARAWYENKRPGLGDEFADCVDAAIASAGRSPLLHPRVHREIRRVLIRRFPYGVFYFTEGDSLVVLAVFHCARDPRIWQTR